LQVEAMEMKLVLSALAPVAAMKVAAAPAAEIERAVATPMVADRNLNVVENTTRIKIHVFEVIGGETIDWKIDPGKSHEFRFKTEAPGSIRATIMVADGGTGPPQRIFSLSPDATRGGYFGKKFSVRITFNAFDVPGSFPIPTGG
jgi:hypothetical protein